MSRSALKNMIDLISEDELDEVYGLLLRHMPEDDILPDEYDALKEALEDIQRGDVYSSAEAWALINSDAPLEARGA